MARTLGGIIGNPKQWWALRNPLKPSWGESFDDIKLRMLEAVWEAAGRCEGRHLVIVSHQTPVLVARLALARRRVPPWLGFAPCQTGSVTSLELEGDRVLSASYYAPPG